MSWVGMTMAVICVLGAKYRQQRPSALEGQLEFSGPREEKEVVDKVRTVANLSCEVVVNPVVSSDDPWSNGP
jgi:hypothetical protein